MTDLGRVWALWLIGGVPVLLTGWVLMRRIRPAFARHVARGLFGALVGGIGFFGFHNSGILMPAAAMLFYPMLFWLGMAYLGIWAVIYFGVSNAVEGSRIAQVLVLVPALFVGGSLVHELAQRSERQAEALEERRTAEAARLARAQSFEWTQESDGLVLIVSPGEAPIPGLRSPPAPVDGMAIIRGLPGAGTPNDDEHLRVAVFARTEHAQSSAELNADGSYELRLPVRAGDRIGFVESGMVILPSTRILLEDKR